MFAPVVRRLEARVADLHRADRPAVELGHEVLREVILRRELLGPLGVLERDRRARVVRRARDDVCVGVPKIGARRHPPASPAVALPRGMGVRT